MAFVSQQDALDYLNGKTELDSVVSLESGGASAPAGPPAGEQVTQVSGALTSAESTPSSEPPTPKDPGSELASLYQTPVARTGTLRGDIFETSDLTQGQAQDLSSQAFTEFYDAAGPVQNFEALGGEETLETALSGGPEDPARDMLSLEYTGPTQVSDEEARGAVQSLAQQAFQFESPAGLEVAAERLTQGLTPGERMFEARRMYEDPEFMARARAEVGESRALAGEHDRRVAQAMEAVEARQQGAADVRQQARDYLTAEDSKLLGEMQAAADLANAESAAVADRYHETFGDGFASVNDLLDFYYSDPNRLQTFEGDPTEFAKTPGAQRRRDAELKLREINAKYADIEHIPILSPMITTHGKENWGLPGAGPGDWFDKSDMPGLTDAQVQRALDRQQEYEYWFRSHPTEDKTNVPYRGSGVMPSTETHREIWGGFKIPIPGREESAASSFAPVGGEAPPSAGSYSDVLPMYGGEGIDPRSQVNVDPHVWLKEGTLATKENMSTQEQRDRYNKIQDLLGELDRLEESNNPFEAAKIAVDFEGYLAAEEQAIQQSKEKGDSVAQSWIDQVNSARRKYRKKKKDAQWGQVTSFFSDLLAPGIRQLTDAALGEGGLNPENLFGGLGAVVGLPGSGSVAREAFRGPDPYDTEIDPSKARPLPPTSFETVRG